jgi:PRC-barrel domain
MRVPTLTFPHPLRGELEYALSQCRGFTVFRGERRIGVVADVRFASDGHWPDELLVRRGRLTRRNVVIAVGSIREVQLGERRVLLQQH